MFLRGNRADTSALFATFATLYTNMTDMPTPSSSTPQRIILGVDPGTNFLGYGIITTRGKHVTLTTTGVIDLHRLTDPYAKLGHIQERITALIQGFKPDELAIEAPFFGKNVQSMLKLGRAQGVVIATAINHHIPVTEYAPLKIKMAITGRGSATKEQVAEMICRLLKLSRADMTHHLDATDALATAYCHYIQLQLPQALAKTPKSWATYARQQGKLPQTTATTGPASKLAAALTTHKGTRHK